MTKDMILSPAIFAHFPAQTYCNSARTLHTVAQRSAGKTGRSRWEELEHITA